MSHYVKSVGWMAPLTPPIPFYMTEEWEFVIDELYNNGSGLEVNYEGTLIFSDNETRCSKENFIESCLNEGMIIDRDNIKSYAITWHNSSDSPMSMATLKQFKASSRDYF